jgi:hypothetical protein
MFIELLLHVTGCVYAILDKAKPPHIKYKRLKLDGGHVYDRSRVLDCRGNVNY